MPDQTEASDAERYEATRDADQARAPLSEEIVAREPLGSAGASGNALERVILRDGRELIRKEVSAEWDWISRATHDDGRVVKMWQRGLFERFPSTIDHATVAAERAGDRWSVFMHDVSAHLVPAERRLGRAELGRVLEAMADLHLAFCGERFDELCTLEDRYNLLSPLTGRQERERGERAGELITRCWEHFAELVPAEIATAIVAMAERPALLAELLDTCEPTLIHGDVRLNNLGFSEDRVVLVDWGERTGSSPCRSRSAAEMKCAPRRVRNWGGGRPRWLRRSRSGHRSNAAARTACAKPTAACTSLRDAYKSHELAVDGSNRRKEQQ